MSKKTKYLLGSIALALSGVGAVNWGLVGIFDFNLVTSLFGPMLTKWIYIIIGISGAYSLYRLTE